MCGDRPLTVAVTFYWLGRRLVIGCERVLIQLIGDMHACVTSEFTACELVLLAHTKVAGADTGITALTHSISMHAQAHAAALMAHGNVGCCQALPFGRSQIVLPHRPCVGTSARFMCMLAVESSSGDGSIHAGAPVSAGMML